MTLNYNCILFLSYKDCYFTISVLCAHLYLLSYSIGNKLHLFNHINIVGGQESMAVF